MFMETEENKKEQFNKVDKITNAVTIVICVILGSIFVGACVYMLNMINENQNTKSSNYTTPQNMNLVSV